MSYTLDFVEDNLSTVRLSLSSDTIRHIEEETQIPLPDHQKIWLESSQTDGRTLIDGKYENLKITLSLRIKATSAVNMDAAIRSLVKEVTRENILRFKPESGTTFYYRTYPYDRGNPGTLHKRLYRLNSLTYRFTITLEASLPFGAEQSITVLDNLVPNWSFEDWTGTDIDYWDKIIVHGSGTSTVTKDVDHPLYGLYGAKLQITASNGSAGVMTSGYIYVDTDRHYTVLLNYLPVGTVTGLKAVISQYDNAGNDLNDDLTYSITPLDIDYQSYQGIVYPAGTGGNDFNLNCKKIKLAVILYNNPSAVTLDGVVFTQSEYLSNHQLTNPLAVSVPAAALSGDLPSPCDIYLSAFDDQIWEYMGLIIGGRENYSDHYNPNLPASVGTTGYSSMAHLGEFKFFTVPTELATDGEFELFAGSGNSTDWTHWVETRDSGMTMEASTGGVSGYCVKFYNSDSTAKTGTLTSANYSSVDRTKPYVWRFYLRQWHAGHHATLVLQMMEYNASNVLVRTTDLVSAATLQISPFTMLQGEVPAGTMHADTVKVKFKFTWTGQYGFPTPAWCYLDGFSFREQSSLIALEGGDSASHLSGYVLPVPLMKFSAATAGKTFGLHGKIRDNITGGDLVPYRVLQTPALNISNKWSYLIDPRFDAMEVPTSGLSDKADQDNLEQWLRVTFPTDLGAGTLCLSHLALIPVDRGYLEISSLSRRHLIVDQNGKRPGVYDSIDGQKSYAARTESQYSGYLGFEVDPQQGSNFCVLTVKDVELGQIAQPLVNVAIKYKPVYLAVAS